MGGPDVEDDDLPGAGAAEQLVPADLDGVVAAGGAEIAPPGEIDIGQPGRRVAASVRSCR